MIVSTSILNKALNDRANAQKSKSEGYSKLESTNAGMGLGFSTGFLIIAVVFVMLELLVLFYCINIAYTCFTGPERIINLVLAITFTLPYALVTTVFVPCAKKALNE
jgi:NADH:ubiquinone oxidoreductase subunit 3 (subunit A)